MPKTRSWTTFFGFQAESVEKSDGYHILAVWYKKTCKKDETRQAVLCPFFFGACVGPSGALRIRHNKFCGIFAEVPKTPCSCGPKRDGTEKNTAEPV